MALCHETIVMLEQKRAFSSLHKVESANLYTMHLYAVTIPFTGTLPELNNFEGCPHTFSYIASVDIKDLTKSLLFLDLSCLEMIQEKHQYNSQATNIFRRCQYWHPLYFCLQLSHILKYWRHVGELFHTAHTCSSNLLISFCSLLLYRSCYHYSPFSLFALKAVAHCCLFILRTLILK